MAKIGFTSIITTCSGTLIAVLAFVAQLKVPLAAEAQCPLFTALGCLGASLFLAIVATVVRYLSELRLANDEDNKLFWRLSLGLVVISLTLLGAGMLFAFLAVYRHVQA